MNTLIARIDTTIEKLSEVSAGINRMVAVHEDRLTKQELALRDLFASLDNRRNAWNESVGLIKAEIQSNVDKSHSIIMLNLDKLNASVERIERWRYLVIGGAFAIGSIFSQNISPLFKMFGTP